MILDGAQFPVLYLGAVWDGYYLGSDKTHVHLGEAIRIGDFPLKTTHAWLLWSRISIITELR